MTITTIDVNYLAVLVSAIVSFLIGGLWYQALFGKTWEKLERKKMGAGKNKMVLLLINFIASLVTSYVLLHTLTYAGATSVSDALIVGFFTWLGYFAVTTILGSVLWEGKSIKLYAMNAGFWLINLLIMSLILTLWPY